MRRPNKKMYQDSAAAAERLARAREENCNRAIESLTNKGVDCHSARDFKPGVFDPNEYRMEQPKTVTIEVRILTPRDNGQSACS